MQMYFGSKSFINLNALGDWFHFYTHFNSLTFCIIKSDVIDYGHISISNIRMKNPKMS